MKLIKCSHCGRPFYNEEKACPYCGHAAHLSATNFVTRPVSDPKSHRLMEDVLSGNYKPEPVRRPESVKPKPTPEPVPIIDSEPIVAPVETPSVPAEEIEPSEALQERAGNIAAAMQQAEKVTHDENMPVEEPNSVDIEAHPRKRRGWVWIIIILIILAIAAAVYLKWDFVYGKISSLIS